MSGCRRRAADRAGTAAMSGFNPDDERCRMQQTVSVCCILFFCILKNEKNENKTGVWKKACGRKAGYSKDM